MDGEGMVRLRPMRVEDEAEVLRAHTSMESSDNFTFALHLDQNEPFASYVEHLRDIAYGRGLQEGFVPATFLLAEVDGVIVGRVSVRHELNDFLAHEGGHIGYGVLTGQRRKGYASEMLRQTLIIARSLGIETALLVTDNDNVGSAVVIERCGGVLQDHVTASDGARVRRYHIIL